MANIPVTHGDPAYNSEHTLTFTRGTDTIIMRSYARGAVETASQRKARVLADVAATLDAYP